jgi:hypothetical protein
MHKKDHQHRLRGLNRQFSRVLVNLVFSRVIPENQQGGPKRQIKPRLSTVKITPEGSRGHQKASPEADPEGMTGAPPAG